MGGDDITVRHNWIAAVSPPIDGGGVNAAVFFGPGFRGDLERHRRLQHAHRGGRAEGWCGRVRACGRVRCDHDWQARFARCEGARMLQQREGAS